MKSTWKSIFFVIIQFSCLAFIGLTGQIIATPILLLLIEILGLIMGVWAVAAMRIGNFSIAPVPLAWSEMVSRGPYRIIRHPMYLALLLTTIPLVITDYSSVRLIVWFILLLNLILKMGYEEDLLQKKFPGYIHYKKQTARLLPGIY